MEETPPVENIVEKGVLVLSNYYDYMYDTGTIKLSFMQGFLETASEIKSNLKIENIVPG